MSEQGPADSQGPDTRDLTSAAWQHLAHGRLDEALDAARRAVDADSGSAEAHLALGVALHRNDASADAIFEFMAATALSPGNIDARYNLAAALAQGGRVGEALGHWRVLAEADPTDEGVREALAWGEARLSGNESTLGPKPNEEPAPSPVPQDPGAWTPANMWAIVAEPTAFFERQKGHVLLGTPVLFMLATMGASLVVQLGLICLATQGMMFASPDLGTMCALFTVSAPVVVGLDLVLAALLHGFSRLQGGRAPYGATVRIIAYAGFPMAALNLVRHLLQFVPGSEALSTAIGVSGIVWLIGLLLVGTRVLHGLPLPNAIAAVGLFIVSLAILAWGAWALLGGVPGATLTFCGYG